MTAGWILPLAATVRLEIKEGGRIVDAGWEFDRTMVSNHGAVQVAGNPKEPAPPCKFHNYWSIRTPPGWSCLFVPPLNRPGQPFECVAGIVDTDTYAAQSSSRSSRPRPTASTRSKRARRSCRSFRSAATAPHSRPEIGRKRADEDERRRTHRAIQSGGSWYRNQARSGR